MNPARSASGPLILTLMLTIWLPGTAMVAQEIPADSGTVDAWMPTSTPWGHPDLQGIWDSKTQTPLERPEKDTGKEFLTSEEISSLERETIEAEGRDKRAEAGTVEDVEGAYNNAFSTFYGTKVVESGRTSLIVDPSDGRVPYTPEAKRRVEEAAKRRRDTRENADGPEDRPSDRCLGFNLPCTSPLCAFSRLVQTPNSVTLYYEAGHWGGAYRTIPLDGRPHAPSHIRQWHGDSRGHWEGTTLVVETRNFSQAPGFQGSSKEMHLLEQFARIDPSLMIYRATIVDATTFTQPWTLEMTWRLADNKQNQIYEAACHEGNYALTSILAGARVLEAVR